MRCLLFIIIGVIALSKCEDSEIKKCNDEFGADGECVPYYLCKDGKINTDGTDVIDIRFDGDAPCADYFEICCPTGDLLPLDIKSPSDRTVPTTCGLRNAEGLGFRITGNNDHEAEYGEFPWMIAILKAEEIGEQTHNVYQCGGSLITPNVVLTAAHCVHKKSPNILKIRAGEWDTQTKNEIYPHVDQSVIDVVIHENYNRGSLYNDVALLFLKDSIPLQEHINTICLPPQNHNFNGKRCFVSGWGKDVFEKEGSYQAILKKIEVPMVPSDICQENLRTTRVGKRFELHESFICAGGEKGKDACKGDGGSPLVCPVDGKVGHYYQAGIVAWGIGCGETNIPGVYANVAKFREWIDAKISAKGLPLASYVL